MNKITFTPLDAKPSSTQATLLHAGDYLKLHRADGWEFIVRAGGVRVVGIVPITEQRELVLVEQFRPALGRRVIELPAGLVGDQDATEHSAEAGKRELLEETGFDAPSMRFLCAGPLSSGTTSETMDLYLAENVQAVGKGGGVDDEDIQTHVIPLSRVQEWLAQQSATVMVDPKIYAGLYFAGNP